MAALPTMQQSRYNCQMTMEQCNNNANITYLHPMLPDFNTNTINNMATTTPKKEVININAFHADREVTSGEAIMCKRINVSSPIKVNDTVKQLTTLKRKLKRQITCISRRIYY
jgi:hypothetical protein